MKYLLSRKLFESKKTENETLNYLNKSGIPNADIVLNDFKDIDNSKNQILLPIIAYFYVNDTTDMNSLKQTFEKMPDLLNDNMIKTPQKTKNGVLVGPETYTDFLKFSEYVDAAHGRKQFKKTLKDKTTFEFEKDEPPIYNKNNIEIYAGKDVGSCVKLGSGYSFCISSPGNTQYQSYRDTKSSTFYFIFDKNRPKTDPLHIIVFDNTSYGVELTDATNNTGTIKKYGSNPDGYIKYLKSKGVPVDTLLINKPKTEQEKEEDEVLGKANLDLEFFKNLSMENKSKYIGRGHELSNEQFDYLIDSKFDDLLKQYVTTGMFLQNERVKKLKDYSVNILKSYLNTIKNRQNTEHRVDLTLNEYYETYLNMVKYNYIDLKDGSVLLFNTFLKDNYTSFKMLLDKGVDPNAKDDINRPILVVAIQNSKKDYVKLLLDYHADPNIIDEDIPFATPLGWAKYYGDDDIINMLINHGAK